MTPAERRAALEIEADRLKARLDKMEAYLSGDQDAWLCITVRLPETVAEVTVDKALAEARQYALAYATVCKTLTSLAGEDEQSKADDPESEFMKRQAEREKARRAIV